MPRGTPTVVRRVDAEEAKKVDAIARRLGIRFSEALQLLAGKDIDRYYRRMKAGESIELGNPGA